MQKMKKALARLLSLALTVSLLISAVSAAVVDYPLSHNDFTEINSIPDIYTTSGNVSVEQTLVMEPGSGTGNTGGATWKALSIRSDDDTAPHAGDIVHAKISLYISPDAVLPADSAPLLKIAAFDESWGNGRDLIHLTGSNLNTLPRGQKISLCDIAAPEFSGTMTQHWYGTIHDAADGGFLQIELHNDMTVGTIEIVDLEIWATRNESSVVYPIGDYRLWDKAANSGTEPYARNNLCLEAGASITRTVAVDEDGASTPHHGDTVTGAFTAYSCTEAAQLEMTVHDGANKILAVRSDTEKVGVWDTVTAGIDHATGVISSDADNFTVKLENTGTGTIRLRSYFLQGVQSMDFDGDGVIGPNDALVMERALAAGSNDLRYDMDQDGQFTAKDISYFRKFILGDTNEFYLNLAHLQFLSEEITINGQSMTVLNLYAEPNDATDLSKGYHYVGDAQEGFACVDDTARAVIALAEHYRLYRDVASLDTISGMLAFILYMQEPDGDFTNFLAKDAAGNCFKKSSASSYKDFSYWASRAYTALAYGYEALGSTNPALSTKVKAAMDLCVSRIDEKLNAAYGTYTSTLNGAMPLWNLAGDNAVSAIAVGALAKHHSLFPSDTKVVKQISRLGEAIYASASGGWTEYPLGGIMHFYGSDTNVWDEWGSIQISALASAGKICEKSEWIAAAELAADSFLTDLLISGRANALTPNKKSYPQINYGAASYVDNLLTLYNVTGKEKYAQWAGITATWWTGNNGSSAGVPMFNQTYGLAFDGIVSPEQVSLNAGGESIVEAIRVLARVLQNDTAKKLLNAQKRADVTAATIEAEDLYRTTEDTQYALAYGNLNDPAEALIKKESTDAGLDESVPQTAQTVLPAGMQNNEWKEVYSNWQGRNAFFCEGVGHNNVRLYKDAYLVTAVGVGGEQQLQAGDYVKLDFMALVQFNTNLSAQVFAVDAQENETLIADDAQMTYRARTWYSGNDSVKTQAISPIPDGTTHLKIQFSVTTDAAEADYAKAYAVVTQAKLFKMGSPEIRSGGEAFSQGSYVVMNGQTERSFSTDIQAAGEYDIYVSVGSVPEDGIIMTLKENGTANKVSSVISSDSGVKIVRLGRMKLQQKQYSFTISNDAEASVNFDALIFYPVKTYADYETIDGQTVRIVRQEPQTTPTVSVPISSTIKPKKETASGTVFADVPAEAYYLDAVNWAVEHHITDGTTAAAFSPNLPCTRAQAVTFLWRAVGSPEPKTSSSVFTDVVAGSYYEKPINWAVESDIVNGVSRTEFEPEGLCTRAQIVALLWRIQKKPSSHTTPLFRDVSANAYYAKAVCWALEKGITNGTAVQMFDPDAPCTRAQIVTFLYRCMNNGDR